MQPTPFADVDRLLDDLLLQMRRALGNDLVGLYLYGSLVTGDFDPEISDVDLLAATSNDVDDVETVGRLREMHDALVRAHPAWEGRIEVAYLSTAALKTFQTRRSSIAVISPGEPFHVKDAGRDWLMNWYVVRERGMTLFGPSPKMIIARVTKQEFLRAVRERVQVWEEGTEQATRPAQAYAILTLCRALYTLRTGEQASKKQAALWAQNELPEWANFIGNALSWRESWRDDQVNHVATYPETARFVHYCKNLLIDEPT